MPAIPYLISLLTRTSCRGRVSVIMDTPKPLPPSEPVSWHQTVVQLDRTLSSSSRYSDCLKC